MDERFAFETEEIRGMADNMGGQRVQNADGIWCWRFPAYVCPHCGPETPPLPDCPQPLARHGRTPRAGKIDPETDVRLGIMAALISKKGE